MEKTIKTVIQRVALNLHKDDCANIIMFLCFHIRDPLVLDTIMSNGQLIFKEIEEFEIQRDTKFLNTLVPQTKVRYMLDRPIKETRKELLEASDSVYDEIEDIDTRKEIQSIEELSIVDRVLYAFSLVKVIGQIIRSYLPGDFGDRIKLTKQCYDIGLQTMKFVLNTIESQIPEIQHDLTVCILRRNPSIATDKLVYATNDWIWALCQSICMAGIKNISHNAGAPELKRVYKSIIEKYPSLGYQFVDVSVELDHFRDVPETKIAKLAKELDEIKSAFCKDLLCLLFIYHVYQFYTPFTKTQKILSILGIQRRVDEPNIFLPTRKTLPQS